MSKFRGFIAIDIESNKKLVDFENEIKKIGADLKLVEPENIHITLKFLGDTEEMLINEMEKIIKNSVKETKPFNIQLKGTGVFPNQNYIKVVWIGIQNSEPIAEIAKKIDEQTSKIGFEKEKRGFSPHLTIARVKTAKNKKKLLQVLEKYRDIEFADIKVETVKLKKSDLTPKGPIYTDLKIIKI
ncbi:MAG: RNA 2',3'-cyclic phosphodiesterase [Candidatus Thermoplasmatota archaeon]|jgi:2'-5' RNA ligase|nr:RNA 2',3'-cyclic phosphodiesterase [Candidatus Thermoplasmatota archaeon]